MNEPTKICAYGANSEKPNVALLLVGVIVGAAAGILFLPLLVLMVIIAGARKLWRSVTGADARRPAVEIARITQELSGTSKK